MPCCACFNSSHNRSAWKVKLNNVFRAFEVYYILLVVVYFVSCAGIASIYVIQIYAMFYVCVLIILKDQIWETKQFFFFISSVVINIITISAFSFRPRRRHKIIKLNEQTKIMLFFIFIYLYM
jgi:hypothetical protein